MPQQVNDETMSMCRALARLSAEKLQVRAQWLMSL